MVVEDVDPVRSAPPGPRVDALEHVANRPIAHHVLDVLESAGVEEVVVASSARHSQEIRDCIGSTLTRTGTPVRYVCQPAPVDMSQGLRLAAPLVERAPCVVHSAAGLLDEPLAPLVEGLTPDSPDMVLIVHQSPAPHEHLSASSQAMLRLREFDATRAGLGMAGVSLFGPGALERVGTTGWRAGDEIDLTGPGRRIQSAGGSLHVRLVDTWRRYAGDPLDLLELNRIALDQLQTEIRRPPNNGNQFEGRVWIHEDAQVSSSVIVGPTVIGPGARVADAYIGPYTSIGADARVEGVEVERSIVAAGASIMHVGGRLVASVVGRDARVFRDFSLPRALRIRIGDGAEIALC